MIKACVICGGEFDNTSGRKRGANAAMLTCSSSCAHENKINRQRYRRKIKGDPPRSSRSITVLKTCVICGGEFEWSSKRSTQKTCSKKCGRTLSRNRINSRNRLAPQSHTCIVCKNEFLAPGEKRKKTCSTECSVWWRKARQSHRSRQKYVPSGTIKQCVVCAKDFVFHRNKITCSHACNRSRNSDLNKVRAAATPPEQLRDYGRKYRAQRTAALRTLRELEAQIAQLVNLGVLP